MGTGEEMEFPLVGVFDSSGLHVGNLTGWDGNSRYSVEAFMKMSGATIRLVDVVRQAGVADSGTTRPTVLAISLGTVCAPCLRMEKDLSSLKSNHPEIVVRVLRATPRSGH